jgi:ectoine hydroxylase-related dioxygenase (phytanoyl-CoA dioxygenase family)
MDRRRQDLERDGYVIVRGLLGERDLERIRGGFDALHALAATLPAGRTGLGGADFVIDREPFRVRRVVWCGGASPALGAYGDDPRVLALVGALLGSDTVVQIIQQAHFKDPGDGVAFALHQDASNRRYGSPLWTDVDGRGSFVQLAIAVDPMTPEAGGLEVVPASHREGFVADPDTGALPAASREHPRLGLALDPGDAVAFGPFLLHGSGPNRSDRPRRLFLQGYALPGANHRVYPGCGTGIVRSVA